MDTPRVIVIGASSGGIEAIRTLVADLPADLNVPICVVIHTSPHSPRVLGDIVDRAGRLAAITPGDKAPLEPGHIYIAPPDCHLTIEPSRVRVTKGPKENRFRPAIDPLFRSAAQVYGPAAIGVILTGNLDDGAAGLWAIKQLGGVAIVQEPSDALYPSMPQSALAVALVDYCVPLVEIGPLLVRLANTRVSDRERSPVPEHVDVEVNIAKEQHPQDAGLERIAEPSAFACPECHGVLLQLHEGDRLRFRCHTGHAYSVKSLLAAVREGVEESLWNSIRSLEECGLLMRHMAQHVAASHDADGSDQLTNAAERARKSADVVRQIASDIDALAPAGGAIGDGRRAE
jgi:two-component system chemotaxis response regulator CheB